jgi:hypothetical protein
MGPVAALRSAKTSPGGSLFLLFLQKRWGCFSLAGLRILCEFSKGVDFSAVFPRYYFLSIPAIPQHPNHLQVTIDRLLHSVSSPPDIPILELTPPHPILPKITPLISCVYGSPFCNPFVFRFMHVMGGIDPSSTFGRSNLRTFRPADVPTYLEPKSFACNSYDTPRKCYKQKTYATS